MAKKNNNSSPPPSEASGADLSMLFSISETIKEQIGLKSRVLEIDRTALNISKKITEASQNQNKGLESRDKLEKQISKNKKLQERAALLAKSYTQDLFGTHKKNYDLALRLQKENIKDLATIQQMQDTAEETGKLDKKTLAALKKAITDRDILLNKMDKSIAKNAQIAIQAELAADELNKETLQREKELALLNEIEKKMGFLGKATKALGQLPVVGQAFADSFAAAEARMKAITEETGKVPNGLEAAKIQLQELEGIAKKAFLAAVVKEAFELDKNLNNIQRSTGQTEAQVNGLNYALQGASAASGNFYMTSSDMLETFSEITKQIGMSAEVLGAQAVVEATALKDQMGLSAEQAGNFAVQARISGKSVEGAGEGVFETVNNFNKLNKTAFNASDILKDVAETSKDIGAQFGFNTAALAEATVQAAELGLELSDLNSIADKLTDFQSSIQSELEAELLTGQELNLEKARELALTNDLAGLGKELESQGITAAKYSKMNRIQQEATASALGMSTDQMGKMLYSQELNAIGAENFKAQYGEQTLEATKQVNIQDKLQKALTKIADALSPIVAAFADIVSHAGVLYSIIGLYIFSKVKTIGSFFSGMKDDLKESASFAKQIFKSIFGKKDGKGTDIGKTIAKKLSDKQILAGFGGKKAKDELLASQGGGPPPVTTTAAPEPSLGEKLGETGEGASKGLKALAEGLKSFADGKVFLGALNLIPTAAGLLAMVAGIPAMLALAAVGIPAGTGLAALGTGLKAFGEAMKALGPMGLAYAAAGLGLLVGSLMGIGFALNLAAPAIEAFGNIIIGVLGAVPGIITAIANGFVTMFSAITSNIGSVLLLGPALLGIAAGLAAMSFAGIGALPVIGALTALGVAGMGLAALSGALGGEEAKKPEPTTEAPGEMTEVVALLKELIAAVKTEGKVVLDGQAVGKALALSSYKT
jgi:hypothetical protein